MLIGVPKEIKNHEYRVGLTPDSVREVVHHGHRHWSSTTPVPVSAPATTITVGQAPRSARQRARFSRAPT